MDVQVLPKNFALIKETIMRGGNLNVKTVVFPKHNHLFQNCDAGLPAAYGLLEAFFSPNFLKVMAKWILNNLNKKNTSKRCVFFIINVAVVDDDHPS